MGDYISERFVFRYVEDWRQDIRYMACVDELAVCREEGLDMAEWDDSGVSIDCAYLEPDFYDVCEYHMTGVTYQKPQGTGGNYPIIGSSIVR